MAISNAFVWGKAGAQLTPDEIAKRREIAAALIKNGMDYSPVGSWTQGAARVSQGILGALDDREATNAERTGRESEAADFASASAALAGVSPEAAAAMPAAVAPQSPQAGVPSASTAAPFGGSQQDFVASILPSAIEESKRTGIDPRIIVAQGALESGWGKHAPGNNLFGIKSHGQPGGNTLSTTEYVNGQPQQQTASFRGYESPTDSVRGYGDFMLQNPRYKPLRQAQGLDAQLEALGASGYATDPKYASSVGAIARGIQIPSDGGTQVASLDPTAGMPPAGMPAPANASQAIEQQAPASGFVDPAVTTAYQQPGPQAPGSPAPQLPPPTTVSAPPPVQQVAQALTAAPQAPTGALSPAVIKALSNPFLSKGHQAVISALVQQQQQARQAQYEQQLKQADPMYQQTLRKAQYENDHLGQVSPDTQATLSAQEKKAKMDADNAWIMEDHKHELSAADPTPDIKEYNFAKSNGYTGSFTDYQLSQKAAARPTTTINTGDNSGAFAKKADEEAATRFGGYISDGSAATRTLGDVQQLADLGTQISTGKGAQALVALGPYAEAIGIDIKGLGPAQAYQSIISRVAPQMRPTGSGSSSDTDVKMFLNGLPSLGNSPQGNQIITQTLAAVQQQKIEAAKIASQAMMPKEAGGITWQQAEQKIRDLGNPYETFNKYRQTLSQNGTQQLPSDNLTVQTDIPGVTIRRKN